MKLSAKTSGLRSDRKQARSACDFGAIERAFMGFVRSNGSETTTTPAAVPRTASSMEFNFRSAAGNVYRILRDGRRPASKGGIGRW
jgi:hypothetical protein